MSNGGAHQTFIEVKGAKIFLECAICSITIEAYHRYGSSKGLVAAHDSYAEHTNE